LINTAYKYFVTKIFGRLWKRIKGKNDRYKTILFSALTLILLGGFCGAEIVIVNLTRNDIYIFFSSDCIRGFLSSLVEFVQYLKSLYMIAY